jgi:epoxide hydrolase-like predicted phosphatase
MIKLIIFDLGGVVINYYEEQYFDFLSKKTGINTKKIKAAFSDIIKQQEAGKITLAEMEKIAIKRLNINRNVLEWSNTFKRIAKPNKKTLITVRQLKKNYKVVLLTNISYSRYISATRFIFDKTLFKKRFVSCYLKMRKPDKKIYLYVLKVMKVKPSEAIFIDNLKENVAGAEKVGIHGLLFTSNEKLITDLKKIRIRFN